MAVAIVSRLPCESRQKVAIRGNPAQAEKIYAALADTDITYLSIGDRQFMEDYHDSRLELIDGGRWRLAGARTPALA
jgi:hypothetical protein